MVFFLHSMVALFVALAVIIWTASTFLTQPTKINWYAWGWGFVAIATIAQAILFFYQR
jgi:hypothetical protein